MSVCVGDGSKGKLQKGKQGTSAVGEFQVSGNPSHHLMYPSFVLAAIFV